MDFYLVERIDQFDYEEYDAAVVVASSEEDAIQQIVDTKHDYGNHAPDSLVAKKIELSRGIVLESYNAG